MEALQTINNLDTLLKEYKENICMNHNEVDHESERNWEDICFGWALAKSLTVDQAYAFSVHVNMVLNDFCSEIDH